MAASSSSIPGKDASEATLHVLHVADCDFFDRFGHMFRRLGLGLYGEGVRVSLLTDDGQALRDLEGTPIDVRGVPGLSGWRAWRLGHFLTSQFSPPPTLVHLWGTTCLRALADWTQRASTPLLIHLTSGNDLDRLSRRGVRANEHVAAGCRQFGAVLQARRPLVAEFVHPVPPALLIPDHAEPAPAPEHTLGVVWTGRFEQRSGLQVLIDALAQLRCKNCDMQVVLIGSGEPGRVVWREIRRQGIGDCVSLIDEPEFWEAAVPGADVCVVPACQDELALAPLAAMALGRVVIASRDQIAEWFIEDRTVWQFTPGSAVELAYHLSRAAERHPDASVLARSAAGYAREHHSITRLIAQLAELYHRITYTHSGVAGGDTDELIQRPVL
jgi:glycosyltransferase involved in cell wall biosynthesis